MSARCEAGGLHYDAANFKVYFAPVEAMTEGCHGVEDVTLGKARYVALETDLYRHGYDAGLTALPYPPRFHGTCAAIRPRGFVIVPSGQVHRCWDTGSQPERAIGSLFDLDALGDSELGLAWLGWSPFRHETRRNCKILPNCAGACAYKFVHAGAQRGEAAILPCPSWKYNIRERLLLRAVKSGALSIGDRQHPRRVAHEGSAAAPRRGPAGAEPRRRAADRALLRYRREPLVPPRRVPYPADASPDPGARPASHVGGDERARDVAAASGEDTGPASPSNPVTNSVISRRHHRRRADVHLRHLPDHAARA